jgi:hypothetical protein
VIEYKVRALETGGEALSARYDARVTALLDAVAGLDPPLRDNLSGIIIKQTTAGYAASMSIALMVRAGARGPAEPECNVTVDAADGLPAGVTLMGWTRYPDQERALDAQPHIEEQIRQLHASGIVGRVNATCIAGTRWVVKPDRMPASIAAWLRRRDGR